jgi:acyl-homoserine lactone acylase PvdQ
MVPPTTGGRSGRPRRALEILTEPGRTFSVEDMKRMALDVKVVHARETIDYLVAALPRAVKDDPEIAAALRLFHEWDGYATVDNTALYLLTTFCWRWSELDGASDRLQRALREAIAYATKHRGRIDVPWGEVHGVERGGRWYPSGGASNQRGPVGSLISLHHGEPLDNRPDERGRFPMQKGSSHVMVAQMTDPPRVWAAKPFGNSADPDSRHHADLTELFAAGKLRRVWLTRPEILANAASVLGTGVELPLPGGVGRLVSPPGVLLEVAAVADDAVENRVLIEESMGRPLTGELRLDGAARYRVLDSRGSLVQDWQTGDAPASIVGSVIVEYETVQGGGTDEGQR